MWMGDVTKAGKTFLEIISKLEKIRDEMYGGVKNKLNNFKR
jgi:hypothetical protein